MPLSGPLLIKPGVFPDQRPCGEDSRKKWIEVCDRISVIYFLSTVDKIW